MKTLAGVIVTLALLALAATAGESWARHGGGQSHPGGTRAGVAPHRHHGFGGLFFFGAPYLYGSPYFYGSPYYYPYPYYPPPYYYGPDFTERWDPPTVYVERFPGTPTPQTQGEIFCPGSEAHYPEVQDCPGGWQRVFRAPEAPAGGG